MKVVKNVILFLSGALLLVFGNKAAIDSIKKPTVKAEEKSVFKRISAGENNKVSQDNKTTLEQDDAETATASE